MDVCLKASGQRSFFLGINNPPSMEESTNQNKHNTNCVRLKSSDTNLNGESRIYYFILQTFPTFPLDLKLTSGCKLYLNLKK